MTHVTKKINYVIAAWHGSRFFNKINPERSIDYLQKHIFYLQKLKHNLTQITISHPGPVNLDEEYKKYIYSLVANNGNIKFIDGPASDRNSYGSWENAYSVYRSNFDYYIFVEDDYLPVLNNFDIELVKLINERPGGGYICGLAHNHCVFPSPIASISNGIACRKSLDFIWERYGRLFCRDRSGSLPGYAVNQQEFSFAFTTLGLPLTDWRHKFKSPYWESQQGYIREFSSRKEDYLIVPYQMIAYPNCRYVTTS